MSYASELGKRLRRKQVAPHDGFNIVVLPHPQKYPSHAGSKGSVFGGICNITCCDNTSAVYLNRGTKGYYCPACAHAINNWQKDRPPLCARVDRNLTHEEMNEQERLLYAEMAQASKERRSGPSQDNDRSASDKGGGV